MEDQEKARVINFYPKKSQEERKAMDLSRKNEAPPDDFRQLSVVPTKEELLGKVKTYLRPIQTQGQFDDLDHYLDCNFRLLKEDFIVDLREGI